MGDPRETSWTVIRSAAAGDATGRECFARRYLPVVAAFLRARWRGRPHLDDLDDAVQEVFVDCFRQAGALSRAEPGHPGGFRAFLYGVTRNVALRFEERRARMRPLQPNSDFDPPADGDGPATVFDREWAGTLLREAARLMRRRAGTDDAALRRVDILRLRFSEDLPIREIARRWEVDPARLHTDYARARREFLRALREVVSFHRPGNGDPGAECARLVEFFG